MSKSFVLRDQPFPNAEGRRRVLVTGAAGKVGSYFSQQCRDRYDLRLMVLADEPGVDAIRGCGEIVYGNLTSPGELAAACEGIDTVVHLAADPRVFATWEDLLPNNIVGIYNMFEAAANAGCRRVVYASSVNAINGYPRDWQIRSDDPVNPANLYGVSKCFGEALCRYYATQKDVSGIALRFAAVETKQSIQAPTQRIPSSHWISFPDVTQLIAKSIDNLTLQFAIFQGVSNNRYKKCDISDAKELIGYEPVDDAFEAGST